jgi:hypothetical protein
MSGNVPRQRNLPLERKGRQLSLAAKSWEETRRVMAQVAMTMQKFCIAAHVTQSLEKHT